MSGKFKLYEMWTISLGGVLLFSSIPARAEHLSTQHFLSKYGSQIESELATESESETGTPASTTRVQAPVRKASPVRIAGQPPRISTLPATDDLADVRQMARDALNEVELERQKIRPVTLPGQVLAPSWRRDLDYVSGVYDSTPDARPEPARTQQPEFRQRASSGFGESTFDRAPAPPLIRLRPKRLQ